MLERRRIFKGRRSRFRFGRTAMVLSGAVAVPLLLALALPANLLGSAPTDRQWHAEAPDIRIVDGETIGLGDRMVRLAGVSAPARGEVCRAAGGDSFDCGGASAAALTRLVGGRGVSCRIVGQDGFGRGFGQCDAEGTELNRSLVGAGYAVASGSTLRQAEAGARQSAAGLWAHGSGAPPGWRIRD